MLDLVLSKSEFQNNYSMILLVHFFFLSQFMQGKHYTHTQAIGSGEEGAGGLYTHFQVACIFMMSKYCKVS